MTISKSLKNNNNNWHASILKELPFKANMRIAEKEHACNGTLQ